MDDERWVSLLDDFFSPPVWSVRELTAYIQDLLREANDLQDLWVRGEVTQVSQPRSGHLYFTLKEGDAVLRCVMWRPRAQRQARRFLPQEGQVVEAHGYVDVYPGGGTYQFYADVLRAVDAAGEAHLAFLRLKARLEAEGLFAAERKRPLPPYPRRIGVVTSATGAALRDILNTLRRRYPLAEVVLAASPVQGADAPQALAQALARLNQVARPDVIILARGGGSAEDLAAFNTEEVVRAVAASPAPVVTGVGHETDTTLVDFAADRRAPTPTAAAELVSPDQTELRVHLEQLAARLQRRMEHLLANAGLRLAQAERGLLQHDPRSRLQASAERLTRARLALPRALQRRVALARLRLQTLEHRLNQAIRRPLAVRRARLDGLAARLQAVHPYAPLQRGYALLTNDAGQVVRDAAQVQPGQRIHARLARGGLTARVERGWLHDPAGPRGALSPQPHPDEGANPP